MTILSENIDAKLQDAWKKKIPFPWKLYWSEHNGILTIKST